jgi:hypothetical protein
MNNDLFHISQQQGIYHTLSLWARLSPRLVKREKSVTPSDEEKPVIEDQADQVDQSSQSEED